VKIAKVLCLASYLTVFFAASCLMVLAQGASARLTGEITDASGALLVQARITAQNTQTMLTQVVESNDSGVYSISPLPPGTYRITVENAGFQQYIENITLTVGQEATINFALKMGSSTQTVTVTTDQVLLNATNAEINDVVSQQTIENLPLNGRDPSSLILLSPGTMNIMNTKGGALPFTDVFATSAGVSAGGGQMGSTFGLLDGVQNMDFYSGLLNPFPNSDATKEFSTATSNYGAQYGFSPNAVINLETTSGTNAVHGGVFEFVRNGDLNARNWFSGAVDTLKRNQFGGFIGAPIRKDKIFYFVNYQATRQVFGAGTNTIFTPTAAMLNGDFSAVPTTLRAPFATVNGKPNQVDPSLLSTAAINIAETMLPLGQDPGTGEVTVSNPSVLSTYNEGTARLDYTISDKQRLFVRSFINEFNSPAANIRGDMAAVNDTNPAQTIKYFNEVISHTWLPTTKFVNVVTASWINYSSNAANQAFTNTGQAFCLSKYVNVVDSPGCYSEGFGVNNDFSGPWQEPNVTTRTTWGLSDHITTGWKNHTFTAGVDFAHQFDDHDTSYPSQPVFNFNGYATGNGLADYVLGDVSFFEQGGEQNASIMGWQLGIYGQDEYKITRNLTLTAGLRWEPDMAPQSVNGGAEFIPGEQSQRYPQAPTGMVFAGDPGVSDTFRPSDYKYFMPRVGIAWQPFGPKTVLRAGFGMFVAPILYGDYNEIPGVAPFAPTFTLNGTTSTPISLQNPWANFAATGGKSPFTPTNFAANPNIPVSQALFVTPISLYSFAPNFRLPETQSWTASVEQQLTASLALHLAYVGSESDHQYISRDLNPGIYANGGARTTYPDFSSIFENQSVGTASYNSLQARIEERSWKGLQFNSSFTWSKVIDDLAYNQAGDHGTGIPDPFNLRFNRGIAAMNVPLTSVTYFIYETPLLNGHNGILRQIAGAWEIGGIWTFQSGYAFGINGGDGNNNSGSLQDQDRGNYVPGQPYDVHSGSKNHWLSQYFNPLAFVANPSGTFGDTGSNFLKGPGVNTADLSLIKNWQFRWLYEDNFQFRCELFNAFNHPSFGLPDNTPTDPNFGQITSIGTIPPRVMQLGAKLTF
jgi:hypothetical protein